MQGIQFHLKGILIFDFQSYELCSKENNHDTLARILSRSVMVSAMLINYCKDPNEIDKISQNGIDISFKAWNASLEARNIQYLADSMYYGWFHIGQREFIKNFLRDEYWRESTKRYLLMLEERLSFIEGFNDYIEGFHDYIDGWHIGKDNWHGEI